MTSFLQSVVREETDHRVKFRRSDNSIYCVMMPATIAKHRKAKTLDKFLKQQRDSGIVIRPIRA